MAAVQPIHVEPTPFELMEQYPEGATVTLHATTALFPHNTVEIPAGSIATIKYIWWPDARNNVHTRPALMLAELSLAVYPEAIRSIDRTPWFAVEVRDPDHLARVQAHALSTSLHTAQSLAQNLAHLQRFTLNSRGNDHRQTTVVLMPEHYGANCLDFFWCWKDADGKLIMNGGLIYREADGSHDFPHWSSHT